MVYRSGAPEDISQLINLRLAYLTEDMGPIEAASAALISQRLPSYFSAHMGKDLLVYVADQGGRLVSTALVILVDKPASPSFPTGRTAILLNVYTLPDFRRQGHAQKLVRMALNGAREGGASYMELKATEAGLNLYRKVGFQPEQSHYTNMKYSFL